MERVRSWHLDALDWDFLRGVCSQLTPDWFWDPEKVPFLLERISMEVRKRLRAPGDSLLIPGLGTIVLEETVVDMERRPRLRVDVAPDWKIGEEER